MKKYIAILTDGKDEWEEVYRVPDLLPPTETIKTTIASFNSKMHKNLKFVRLKKQRTNG